MDDFSIGGWLRAVSDEGAYAKHLHELTVEMPPVYLDDFEEDLDFQAGLATPDGGQREATKDRLRAEPAVMALHARLVEEDRQWDAREARYREFLAAQAPGGVQ